MFAAEMGFSIDEAAIQNIDFGCAHFNTISPIDMLPCFATATSEGCLGAEATKALTLLASAMCTPIDETAMGDIDCCSALSDLIRLLQQTLVAAQAMRVHLLLYLDCQDGVCC